MRIITKFIIFLMLTLFCCSCFVHDINYPKKMIFPAEGGEMVKEFSLLDFEISDYMGDVVNIDSIGGSWTLKWLTVETLSPTESRISVGKNTTGRPRRLYINRFEDPGYTEIMIIQLR